MEQTVFDTASDEQLVTLAAGGDADAMEALIGRYMPVARAKAAHLHDTVQLHDSDDLSQEAMVGFLSAVYTFDADRNTSFSTYAGVCMANRLSSVLSSLNAKRQVPRGVLVPLETAENTTADVSLNPETAVIAREQAENIAHLLATELSDLERDVFRLYLSGCPYSDIALRLSADEKAVDNALQRARRKLRAALSNHN